MLGMTSLVLLCRVWHFCLLPQTTDARQLTRFLAYARNDVSFSFMPAATVFLPILDTNFAVFANNACFLSKYSLWCPHILIIKIHFVFFDSVLWNVELFLIAPNVQNLYDMQALKSRYKQNGNDNIHSKRTDKNSIRELKILTGKVGGSLWKKLLSILYYG